MILGLGNCFALDPKGQVARTNDNGDVLQNTVRNGIPKVFRGEDGKKKHTL